MRTLAIGSLVACALLLLPPAAQAKDFTFVTDADAYVWSGSWWEPSQGGDGGRNGTYGGDTVVQVMPNDNTFKTYLHFDISALPSGLAILSGSLKLTYVPSYPGGNNRLWAIMDETGDWNLSTLAENAINYNNAPQNDLTAPAYGTWLTQFLNTGTSASSITRELATFSDAGDVNQDVTAVLKWLAGKDAAYSTFIDTDKKLTFVLANISTYCGSVFDSKEYTPLDGSDAPRIEVQAYLLGDASMNDQVDFTDYQTLESNFGTTTGATWEVGDFDGDGDVDFTDYQLLESNFGSSVPEPATLALLAFGGLGGLKRRW